MHKSYIYVDGKVIINDDTGNYIQSEYYDILDKVLIQENVIEEIDNQIKKLTKEMEEYPEEIKRFIPIYIFEFACVAITVPIAMGWLNTGTNPFLYNINSTLFGSVNYALFSIAAAGSIALPLGILADLTEYYRYKARANERNAINIELKYLKLQLEKEKEKLYDLQKQHNINNEIIDLKSNKINHKEELVVINNKLKNIYNIGYNKEKYYNYYQQGILDTKLQNYYNEDDIKFVTEYLEENGPVLNKKK